MPVSILPSVIGAGAFVSLASICLLVFALMKRRSPAWWFALAALIVSSTVGYAAYSRLERIHSTLFSESMRIKTRQELQAQLGQPSREESYMDGGKKIDVWFYDITLLQPPVHAQFQFCNEGWVGTFYVNR
jgi:hypothetical protein